MVLVLFFPAAMIWSFRLHSRPRLFTLTNFPFHFFADLSTIGHIFVVISFLFNLCVYSSLLFISLSSSFNLVIRIQQFWIWHFIIKHCTIWSHPIYQICWAWAPYKIVDMNVLFVVWLFTLNAFTFIKKKWKIKQQQQQHYTHKNKL